MGYGLASRVPRASHRALRIGVVGLRGMPSNYSGIERVSEELYPSLVERGHEVTVYCRPHHQTESRSEFKGVRLVQTGAIAISQVETFSQAISSFLYSVRAGRFDVIHLHALAPALVSAGYRLKRVPTVLTIHGLDWQRAKWKGLGSIVLKQAERWGVRYADEIIVVSQDLKDYFWKRYARRTTLVYNAIDFSEKVSAEPCPAAMTYGLRPQRYVIFVGRLVPEKRVNDLITAFGRLESDYNLVIAGDGASGYVSRLKGLARRDKRILFVGQQTRSQLRELFSCAAAYILPSELEGFPLSLIECVGYGVPAIASDIPPHRELLGSIKGYDLLFRVRDTTDLTARLARVLSRPQQYKRVAEIAREHVKSKLSLEEMVDRTEEVLIRAADRRLSRR
jgi:glycosyltransferase involved in cell wall biosynthesis